MSRQEPVPFLGYGAVSDPQDMRRSNRNLILRSLITRGAATRAELARRTGMSRPTVSVIANDLLTSGVLVEGERVSSGGAPGTLLEMARDTGVTFVVDMRDLERITLATVTATGELVTHTTAVAHDETELPTLIAEAAARVERRTLLGAALAVRGFVDPAGVWVQGATPAVDVTIVEKLRRTLRMPVFAVNATDAITIADLRDSPEGLAAQGTLVADAGLGLIMEGRLLTGQKRPLGDIAHVVPGIEGPLCPVCHRTCLSALLATADSATFRERAAAAIAAVMAPIIAAIELEEVVLASLPPAAAQDICELTREHLAARLPADLTPDVRLSQQGEAAVLVGAAAMLLYSRLS